MEKSSFASVKSAIYTQCLEATEAVMVTSGMRPGPEELGWDGG